MKFIRFNLKDQGFARLVKDKFALFPEPTLQLTNNCFHKARSKFTHYMSSKSDKFGIKFWLAADVDTKYLSNGFPYLGKDDNRPPNQSLSEHVMKLIAP
ncbi:hypothetical protein PR048_005153 [Dryococelus australis]|uniref:PiggyBac transposable element-derived protein domain-containing protein n=1 Tax=Dryococelus australis TaxID=614101 RepID=A0ABQ9I7E4_9NEOP|nr:hypothetical protein PR048_005153 [Dryococelus australis]